MYMQWAARGQTDICGRGCLSTGGRRAQIQGVLGAPWGSAGFEFILCKGKENSSGLSLPDKAPVP